jgi:AcrR family transcriptional regulator
MVTQPGYSRRQASGPRKGDLREQQILDAAEKVLATRGYLNVTVNEIAEAAGITRGALYFYFASKQDIVTALVARTAQALRDKSGAALNDTAAPDVAIAKALDHTAQLWIDHGVVMRAAVDLASTVPEIEELWTETAHVFIDAISDVLKRVGVPPGRGVGDAPALARALCWMIERTFYQASKMSVGDLNRAKQTCQLICTRMASSE